MANVKYYLILKMYTATLINNKMVNSLQIEFVLHINGIRRSTQNFFETTIFISIV